MLLGNKCDMEEKRCIPKERGEMIAKEHGIKFYETSAKSNINIETAFLALATDILNKTPMKDTSQSSQPVDMKPSHGSKPNCCST